MYRHFTNFNIIFALILLRASAAHSALNNEHPIHHQFNAKLLKPHEKQISIAGNAKLGITENLELGTQLFFLLGKINNISIKHRMFDLGEVQTAFSSHSFIARMEELSFIASFHGVTTDYELSSNANLSLGVFDLFVHLNGKDNLRGEFHTITPMLAYDQIINSNWGITGLVFLPLLGSLELVSNFADIEALFEYYKGIKSEEGYPAFFFFSATNSWDRVNFELGALMFTLDPRLQLYFNVFWRFQ